MKRDFLKELGITDEETINKILNENSSDIGAAKKADADLQANMNGLKDEKANLLAEKGTLEASLSESKKSIEALTEELNTTKKQLSGYQISSLKTKIAVESGIPIQLADRLSGEDEKTLRQDAETLSAYLINQTKELPLASTERVGADSSDSAYKALLNQLQGE